MSSSLPADIYSPDQVGIVLWELGKLIGVRRDEAVRATVSGQPAGADFHISALLLSVLRSAAIKDTDVAALEKLQSELVELRQKAPVAHFLLSALPNRAFKRMLVEWCRQNFHQDLLVTFATRGDLGGGFVLRVGSKQYDFTYKTRLLEDKHRLVEIFNDVR